MKQAYGQLNFQIKQLTAILEIGPVRVQKIFALPNFLVLEAYARHCGEIYLYLGTGKLFQCFFITDKRPPVNFRIPSKFRSLINKYFSGQMLVDVKLSQRDRIITLIAGGKLLTRFSFFWSVGRLYFIYAHLEQDGFILKYSWNASAEQIAATEWDLKIESEFSKLSDLGIYDKNLDPINFAEILHNYFYSKTSNKQKIKKLTEAKKKLNRINHHLDQVYKFEILKQWMLINLDIAPELKLVELGLRHKFLKEESIHKKRSKLFEKIKKTSQDILHLENIKKDIEETISKLNLLPDEIINKQVAVHPQWEEEVKPKNLSKKNENLKREFKVYLLKDGSQVGIGLSDVGNDMLRNKWAKKNDYWFHIHQKPSAHAWVRTQSGLIDVSSSPIQLVAYLLGDEKDHIEIDLMYAKRENIKAKKGQVGGVKVSNYKIVRLYTNKLSMELIARIL